MLRSTLLKLSDSPGFARWVISNNSTRSMSRRFVAGETLDEAIAAARKCNDVGMLASLDYLGENVSTTTDAQRARDAYLEIFDRIAKEKLDANVSCKLTQMGLDLSAGILRGAGSCPSSSARRRYGNFLRVDMEGSVYTQRTVELVKRIRARNAAIGTVIQAYLYRSERRYSGLAELRLPRFGSARALTRRSSEVAFERKQDVDGNYVRLMQMLLPSGVYHGIATHDPKMIGETIRWAAAKQISKDDFEFQMLYGIRTDLQRRLVKGGYRVRVYIPYGQDWFPYFMRRLAERPANIGFLLRNFFRQ